MHSYKFIPGNAGMFFISISEADFLHTSKAICISNVSQKAKLIIFEKNLKKMQKILIAIDNAPYGNEKTYNALRMAMTLQKEYADRIEIKIFLLADAVFCGLPNQNTPNG